MGSVWPMPLSPIQGETSTLGSLGASLRIEKRLGVEY